MVYLFVKLGINWHDEVGETYFAERWSMKACATTVYVAFLADSNGIELSHTACESTKLVSLS